MIKPASKTPRLTRGTQAFIDALTAKNAPPLHTLSPEEARQVLIDVQSQPIARPDASIRDMDLPVGPTGKVSIRIVRPRETRDNLPLILYFHGGGWILGNKETHDRLVRELAAGSGSALVFVNYSPSPEAQYPVPIEQAYAVLEYVAKNAKEFSVDANRIVVAGDSVGGNMAAVVALLAKERKGPKIIFQLLFYPVTGADFDTESYQDFADGPWLTRDAMKWFWDAYLPEKERRSEITASPIRATRDQLTGLPPALIITAENDVLRDEGETYAARLDDAGVPSACLRCNGTIHDFLMLDALSETAPTRAALCMAVAALKNACVKNPE